MGGGWQRADRAESRGIWVRKTAGSRRLAACSRQRTGVPESSGQREAGSRQELGNFELRISNVQGGDRRRGTGNAGLRSPVIGRLQELWGRGGSRGLNDSITQETQWTRQQAQDKKPEQFAWLHTLRGQDRLHASYIRLIQRSDNHSGPPSGAGLGIPACGGRAWRVKCDRLLRV